MHENALIHETSPYLQQHAHNPVDWYPWCAEALQRARRENKPILLSIGYSACHWCHVMAHESFEDPETARVMNEHFVNIKVDREERPDLDKIYQTAHHLLTQRTGGWPLTMFLAPDDQTPFFGGTYFPRQPRHGLPSFTDLLKRVASFYDERHQEIRKQNESLKGILQQLNPPEGGGPLDDAPLVQARRELEQAYDTRYAGFGQAPKFPHPTNIERLLRHWAASIRDNHPDDRALEMARMTLHAMGSGGIYDQLGGGFCRYAVDDYWMIPHFEKMLYDNGPLLALYTEGWLATGDAAFARIARETAEWAMREMQSPQGGYYSSLDADSEGEEGKFYVWTPDEVRGHLGEQEYQVFVRHYGLDRQPNFEGRHHLHVFRGIADIARALKIDEDQVVHHLDAARRKLFAVREQRVRPGRDEKILTSWNALMIRGMAVAGRYLGEPAYTRSAERALDFVRAELWHDGRLLATFKDGKAHLMAYLDDYAFLIAAILDLLQARWRDSDVSFAVELADVVLEHFEDREQGGFFFTADDHERLIQRPKPLMDESVPSGNGIAACALGRLGHLLGEPRYLDAAERTLKSAWRGITDIPYAHNTLLNALEEYRNPPQTIVLRGDPQAMQPWHARCSQDFAPMRLTLAVPQDARNLPGALADRKSQDHVVAYVCTGHTCSAPVTRLNDLPALK